MTAFWSDIEILQFVDACEQGKRSAPNTGSDLLRTLAADRGVDVHDGDYARFLRELVVLGQAELLLWSMVQLPPRVRQPTPAEPQGYLDHMREFVLTYKGRNQAKGRVIYEPTPDPAEDDGRMIRSMTLEDIAGIIGAAYPEPVEVLNFLADSEVSLEGFSFGDRSLETAIEIPTSFERPSNATSFPWAEIHTPEDSDARNLTTRDVIIREGLEKVLRSNGYDEIEDEIAKLPAPAPNP